MMKIQKKLLKRLIQLAELGVEHRDFPAALPPEFTFPEGTEGAEEHHEFGVLIVEEAKALVEEA